MVYQFTKRRIDSPAYGWICTVGFLFLAAFLVGPDGGLAADRIDVSSKIRSVSLFPRQALVTREASLAVDKGLCELALAIDAANVDADSVSARVFGDGELFSVQLKKIYLRAAAQENIRTLEKRLHELRISRRQAEDDKAVIAKKERFLKSVVDFSATQLPREIQTVYPGMDDLQKTLTFLGDRFDELSRGKQTLDGKIDSVDKEIRIVEKELAALARPSDKKKQIVEIIFDSSTAQQIRIETDYLVRNAFWQPLYKAAVPTAMNHVDLTLFSRIRQQTGEDWNAVELSLSNIVPLRGATLPRLPGWYLDIVRPPVSARYRKKDAIEEKMGAARDKEMTLQAESAARAPSVSIAVAKRTELPLSFAYRMPRRLSVESREKETLLPVYRKTLEGTFLHLAVPRRSPFPFLVCRTAADREMMAGPMNVHFGSHFVGKTFLAEGAAGRKFDLNLGVDRQIRIRHENIKDAVKETIFGTFERKTLVRSMAFVVTIENLKQRPVLLHLVDHIPVARTDKIKVEDVRMDPMPTEPDYQGTEGLQLWVMTLAPREVKKIEISFVVSHPRNEPVSGL